MRINNKIIMLLFIAVVVCSRGFSVDSRDFIRRQGRKLVVNEREIRLRGIGFGNDVYIDEWEDFQEIPIYHHDEKDYKRIKEWGMNVVRFYMNYKTFEDDFRPFKYKQSGWDWIDRNIAWARKYGIYIILDMHIAQGGTQYTFEGESLWGNKNNQKRFIALWKAIASRYKDEPVIVGYDLLNEPVVPKSINQWKSLAERAVKEIREVDNNHLIVMECVLGISTDFDSFFKIKNLFLIDDDDTLYSFHYYFPMLFTHQFTIWSSQLKEGGKYPDEDTGESTMDRIRMKRNKDYLAHETKKYADFSAKNNVPVYCGEFGTDYHCFEKDKGGEIWAGDLIDIFIKNDIHFTYHCYHESWFGVFQNDTGLPDEKQANNKLIEVFKSKLLKKD